MSYYSTTLYSRIPTAPRRAERGQAAVVALLVLLLLGVVGALFITVVSRNVVNALHASRVVSADYYARAGITFADAQMTYGPDGADWRPPLQYQLANPPSELREAKRYAAVAASLPSLNDLPQSNDPDKAYLAAGFTRYTAGDGRFLLRVTYDPVNVNSASANLPGRYLKIESIGREGVIDPIDPTTYSNNRSSDRTQAYQVAYKPIGITDYARFETNIDNRSDIANLGVASQYDSNDHSLLDPNYPDGKPDGYITTPGATDFSPTRTPPLPLYPVVTTYGAADAFLPGNGNSYYPNPNAGAASPAQGAIPGGGSLRANMPARFFGKNIVYLNPALTTAPAFQDTVEIAGNLLLDNYQPSDKIDNSGSPSVGQRASLVVNPPLSGSAPVTSYVVPSNSDSSSTNGSFSTQNGLVRDGVNQNDANGQPRSIKRLDPPLMDSLDPGSNLPRYKQMALNSPPRLDPSTAPANSPLHIDPSTAQYYAAGASQYGYGRAIYINNTSDLQPESSSISGGTTLTDEWLHTSKASFLSTFGGWKGDLYDPPGVNITLGEQTAIIKGAPTTFAGIRLTRFDTNHWTTPVNGLPITNPSDDGTTSSTMYVSYDSLEASNDLTKDPSTLSGGLKTSYQDNPNNDVVIYAEGNVRVHGIVSPTTGNPNLIPRHITIVTNGTAYIDGNVLKGSPDSSITILAHDYVCINTTQFFAGTQNENYPALLPDTTTGYYTFNEVTDQLVQDLSFGLPDSTKNVGQLYPNPFLYVSGASESGAANLAQVDFNFTNPLGTLSSLTASPVPFGDLSHQTFDLSTSVVASLLQTDVGQLQVHLDDTNLDPAKSGKFLLQRLAVLPSDIRIEAVLYAQTRSFFVIPGASFNDSADDTINAYTASGTRPTASDPRFPFYGQPIDMKIVIDGAVSEAHPADINAQTAWMLRWGWIPQFHGNYQDPISGLPELAGHSKLAGHNNIVGLQMIYNPQAGYPYYHNPNSNSNDPIGSYYLRSDQYGRPLPFSPRLPVSTGLLYAGESGEAPILQ